MTTKELTRGKDALGSGEYGAALYWLREAERVAVAQRKADELVEVLDLVRALSARSSGRTKHASERFADRVEEEIGDFPAEALAAVGIPVEPPSDPLALVLSRPVRRPRADSKATTRELTRAGSALVAGKSREALGLLREARRVAVAQRKLDELLMVYELLQALGEAPDRRTRTAAERLALRTEDDLRSFAGST